MMESQEHASATQDAGIKEHPTPPRRGADLMVKLGRFFFRYRNIFGPVVFLVGLAFSRPEYPFGSSALNIAFDIAGAIVALLGQSLRVLTIGYEYIVRGGRNRQVYADALVQGGVFAHCRNPLYVGNVLMLVGLALVIHAVAFYVIVIPAVVFVYACIVAAEETYLREKFGGAYDDYMLRVNRWWPRLTGFRNSVAGMRFNWRRVLVKEYNTTFILVGALVFLRLWSEHSIVGSGALPSPGSLFAGIAVWAGLYLAVRALKKSDYITD
jgi:protein-S-isoprenylcysteine O-methyltransferase Ste14